MRLRLLPLPSAGSDSSFSSIVELPTAMVLQPGAPWTASARFSWDYTVNPVNPNYWRAGELGLYKLWENVPPAQ